ncbi:hypothetical protein AVEN_151304-1 [Araneus ventricosus]|uniref:Uncharacterized protein n=1 Tax=Araneus ventricosus TaxID=182803 RepID=A0A4Y2HXE5_ARAVE|nr:hypothetical protein AVEN_151304-1 [Araneus ventricosus]
MLAQVLFRHLAEIQNDENFHKIALLTLSIRERPKRLFKQNTMAVRISLRNFQPLSLSVIDFSPDARIFFVRVARPDGLGEKEGFLRIRSVPAVIVVFEEGRGISLMFERGTRMFPYFEATSIPMVLGIRGLMLGEMNMSVL